MRLEAAMLANYAEARGALLTVVGGGWEFATLNSFPGRLGVFVTGILVREHEEMGESVTLSVRLYGPSGDVIAVLPLPFDTLHTGTAEGVPWRTPFVAQIEFPVNETGVYRVTIQDGTDDQLGDLPFDVQHPRE